MATSGRAAEASSRRGRRGESIALALGAAGLAPFFAAGAAIWAGPRLGPFAHFAPVALLAYAATIAAFLGGVRWGVTIAEEGDPDPPTLIAAVAPQIAAWALVVAPISLELRYAGLFVLIAVQGAADLRATGLPDWYRRLRLPLTVGACAALASGVIWAVRLAPPH